MLRTLVITASIAAAAAVSVAAQDINVITTTQDLADIAKRIGGDLVAVESLAKGDQDLHRIAAKPSFLLKLKRADFFVELGLDAEHAWVPALIEGSRNEKIREGGVGFVNCSAGLKPLEIPKTLDRSMGVDFHPRGNPHYNMDPEGGRLIARNMLAAFGAAYPAHAAEFKRGHDAFIKALDEKIAEWAKIAAPLKGAKFVSRHPVWPYLAERYGFSVIGDLEPKPGIEPTPSHVSKIIELMKRENVAALLVPPYLDDALSQRVARESGRPLVAVPIGTTGVAPDATYLDYLDHLIRTLADAASKAPRSDGKPSKS